MNASMDTNAQTPADLASVRATLAAARAARGDRRPAPLVPNYVPVPDPAGDGIDWTPALGGPGIDRYIAVSNILEELNSDDETANVAPMDARTSHVDGKTPDRAILSGDWTDAGRAADWASDAVNEISRWALRQPADAVAVLPMRNIVRDAVDAVTAETDSPVYARVADAIAHGMAQADSSGRIIVSRLANVAGIAEGYTDRRRSTIATAVLEAWRNDVAAIAAVAIDDAENGTPVRRVTVPRIRPVVTRHGVGIVTGSDTFAHGIAMDRDVLGISFAQDRKDVKAMRKAANAGRIWSARERRTDGSTWSASDGARVIPSRTVVHPENGAPVFLDEVTIPGAFRHVEMVSAPKPEESPVIVRKDESVIRAPRALEPVTPGAIVDVIRPASAVALVTMRADLTGAALADDLRRIRGERPTGATKAPTGARGATGARRGSGGAPAGTSALDALRSRAAMRRTTD